MSPGLLGAALMRLVDLADPYQAYDFECTLHRPSGQVVVVGGSIRGADEASRKATLRGDPSVLVGGTDLPVEIGFGPLPDLIERETFRTRRGDVSYIYTLDRSIPFEDDAIGMTVIGVDFTQDDPMRLSALGFCRTRDLNEEEPSR